VLLITQATVAVDSATS